MHTLLHADSVLFKLKAEVVSSTRQVVLLQVLDRILNMHRVTSLSL